MTIISGYLTNTEAADYLKTTVGGSTDIIDDAVTAVSRMIDRFCGRHFYQVTATARVFDSNGYSIDLGPYNDLVSVTSLKTDDNDDGTYETTWTATQYQLLPVGATTRAPLAVPYTEVVTLSGYTFPTNPASGRKGLVEITGTWGWPTAVPTEVKQAARLLLAEMSRLQDAPFGVAGNDVTGFFRAPSQMPPRAKQLLGPLVHPCHVGVG